MARACFSADYFYLRTDLRVANDSLVNLGLKPTRLSDGLMQEVFDVAMRHANRCDRSRIMATARW